MPYVGAPRPPTTLWFLPTTNTPRACTLPSARAAPGTVASRSTSDAGTVRVDGSPLSGGPPGGADHHVADRGAEEPVEAVAQGGGEDQGADHEGDAERDRERAHQQAHLAREQALPDGAEHVSPPARRPPSRR